MAGSVLYGELGDPIEHLVGVNLHVTGRQEGHNPVSRNGSVSEVMDLENQNSLLNRSVDGRGPVIDVVNGKLISNLVADELYGLWVDFITRHRFLIL